MNESKIIPEEVTDPGEDARRRARAEQDRRNVQWLKAHWPEIAPQAYGKYLLVAGEQAFIAETAEEAVTLARAAHPEEDDILPVYVYAPGKARLYGYPWGMRTL